jgi:hypothetical protein
VLLPIPTTTPPLVLTSSHPFGASYACLAVPALQPPTCRSFYAATYTPPHQPLLLLTRLRVAVGAATGPYYHPLVLPRHQPTLPAPRGPDIAGCQQNSCVFLTSIASFNCEAQAWTVMKRRYVIDLVTSRS